MNLYEVVDDALRHLPNWFVSEKQERVDARVIEEFDHGYRIQIKIDKSRSKFVAQPIYPTDSQRFVYPYKVHKINVAMKRGSKTLAKEIERRLIPLIKDEWEDVRSRIETIEENRKKQQKVLDRVTALTGFPVSDDCPDSVFITRSYIHQVTVGYDGSYVDVRLSSIPFDVFEKLYEIMKREDH